MLQTKNALNNLIARYKSVLTHCKLLNAGVVSCAFVLGVSTCISFSENAWAVDKVVGAGLTENISTDGVSFDSVSINGGTLNIVEWSDAPSISLTTNSLSNTGGTLNVWEGTLTVKNTLSNSGTISLNNWGAETNGSAGFIKAESVTSSGSFVVDNAKLDVSGTIANSGNFQVNNANSDVDASALINTAGEFKINGGTVDITSITNSGTGQFTFIDGILNATSINNSSKFNMSGGTNLNLDTLYNITTNAYFGLDGASTTLTVAQDTTNYGTIELTNGAFAKFESSLVNEGALIAYNPSTTVNVTKDFTNGTTSTAGSIKIAGGADVTVGTLGNSNTFTNANGTVDVMNAGTSLTVHGNFINGTDSTEGILHIHEDDAVVKITGDFTNTNGLVGVHSGTLTIDGEMINNSDSKSNVDAAHPTPQESIHVHDAKLIVASLTLNKGGLGLYNGATGDFEKVTALSGSEIHAYGGGTFQADSGDIDGMFTIHNEYSYIQGGTVYHVANGLLEKTGTTADTLALASLASFGDVKVSNGTLSIERGYNTGTTSVFTVENGATFTKNGSASDVLTLSHIINNNGTMKVEHGGLVVKNLATNAYGNTDFATNGNVIITGSNSYLQTGDMHHAAMESLLNEGYAQTDAMHSALNIKQATVALNDGVGIVLATKDDKLIVSNSAVDATIVTSAKTVDFDAGTLFKINGHGFSRDYAFITIAGGTADAGSVDINGDAKFLATNLTADTYYTLVKNVSGVDATNIKDTGWYKSVEGGSIDRMIEDAEVKYVPRTDTQYGTSTTDDIVIVSGGVTDKNFGVDEDLFENMKDLWEAGKNDKDSPNAGTGFVSGATDKTEIHDDDEAGKTLESALNVAVTGGVAGMTTDASNIASQAVNHRIDGVRSEAGDYYEDISATDWGLWAIPLYQQSQVRGMKIGKNSGGYDGYITGAIIGLDRKKDEWTAGIAFGLGFGEAESVGNYASTKTQLDFWSAIIYGGYHKGNFEIKGDFTYTQTRSEISQDNPYHLVSMSNISADVDSQLYSIGTTASYRMEGDNIDVTPHIGVRYRAYHQDSFTSTLGRRDLFHVHDGHMETWLLPVGVTFSDTYLHNDWLITPRLDVSYTAVFGDTTIMNRVNIAGSGADVDAFGTANIEADVLDYGFASLSLGCGAKKEDWSFGLDFDFQMSERRQAQGVFARAAYRF